jgi:hypothetical protein
MHKALWIATLLAGSSLAQAQTGASVKPPAKPASAASASSVKPASAAKKALVAQLMKLQQAGIEGMASTMAAQPATQLMQQANLALQQLPADRREAVAREIEADARKYVAEAGPIVRQQALALAPAAIGPILEQNFTEDELRQIIALLQSPVNRKFQQMAPDMQRALSQQLVAHTQDQITPKVRVMQESVIKHLKDAAETASAPAASAAKR